MQVFTSPVITNSGGMSYGKQFAMNVGVGLLPYMKIGSLWYEGNRIGLFPLRKVTFKLRIASDNPIVSTLQEALGDEPGASRGGRTVLGTALFDTISRTNCLVYRYDTTRRKKSILSSIIFPVMEIVRFYYATGTRLSNALFTGEVQGEDLSRLCSEGSGLYDDVAIVKLKSEYADSSAYIIGRWLGSPHARAQAIKIYQTVRKGTINRRADPSSDLHVSPEVTFPFLGPTDLSVQGTYLTRENGERHFLVSRLLRCTAPFPYEAVTVERPLGKIEETLEGEEGNPIYRRPFTRKRKPKGRIKHHNEPNLGLRTLSIDLYEENFPDLENKPLHKTYGEAYIHRTKKRKEGEEGDDFSSGSGVHGGSGPRGIRLNTDPADEPPKAQKKRATPVQLAFTKDALDTLRDAYKVPYTLLDADGQELSEGEGFALLPSELRLLNDWAEYEVGEEQHAPRPHRRTRARIWAFHHLRGRAATERRERSLPDAHRPSDHDGKFAVECQSDAPGLCRGAKGVPTRKESVAGAQAQIFQS